jgi:hypothetical protein
MPRRRPRAQAAHRLALGHEALDDAVGVLLDDPVVDAEPVEVGRQHLGGKARLLLVEVDATISKRTGERSRRPIRMSSSE